MPNFFHNVLVCLIHSLWSAVVLNHFPHGVLSYAPTVLLGTFVNTQVDF